MDKSKKYKQPVFVAELISRSTVVELFDLVRDFEVYQKFYMSINEWGKGNITYGVIVDNHHFEGDEIETKIFLIGLFLAQKLKRANRV